MEPERFYNYIQDLRAAYNTLDTISNLRDGESIYVHSDGSCHRLRGEGSLGGRKVQVLYGTVITHVSGHFDLIILESLDYMKTHYQNLLNNRNFKQREWKHLLTEGNIRRALHVIESRFDELCPGSKVRVYVLAKIQSIKKCSKRVSPFVNPNVKVQLINPAIADDIAEAQKVFNILDTFTTNGRELGKKLLCCPKSTGGGENGSFFVYNKKGEIIGIVKPASMEMHNTEGLPKGNATLREGVASYLSDAMGGIDFGCPDTSILEMRSLDFSKAFIERQTTLLHYFGVPIDRRYIFTFIQEHYSDKGQFLPISRIGAKNFLNHSINNLIKKVIHLTDGNLALLKDIEAIVKKYLMPHLPHYGQVIALIKQEINSYFARKFHRGPSDIIDDIVNKVIQIIHLKDEFKMCVNLLEELINYSVYTDKAAHTNPELCSYQKFKKGCRAYFELSDLERREIPADEWAKFGLDILQANTDRHEGNFLVMKVTREEYKEQLTNLGYPIDHLKQLLLKLYHRSKLNFIDEKKKKKLIIDAIEQEFLNIFNVHHERLLFYYAKTVLFSYTYVLEIVNIDNGCSGADPLSPRGMYQCRYAWMRSEQSGYVCSERERKHILGVSLGDFYSHMDNYYVMLEKRFQQHYPYRCSKPIATKAADCLNFIILQEGVRMRKTMREIGQTQVPMASADGSVLVGAEAIELYNKYIKNNLAKIAQIDWNAIRQELRKIYRRTSSQRKIRLDYQLFRYKNEVARCVN